MSDLEHTAARDAVPEPPARTGERFTPELDDSVLELEHMHRYMVAGGLAAGKRVLDIGCGVGYGSAMLAAAGADVTGIDIDAASVDYARLRYGQESIDFVCASAASLPFDDASFDLCVAFEVIEHVEDSEALVLEARRVLRDPGMLICSTPNRLVADDSSPEINPFHRRWFDPDEFRDALASSFRVELLGQVVAVASLVWPLDGSSEPPPFAHHALPEEMPLEAKLLIALCWTGVEGNAAAVAAATMLRDGASRVLDERTAFYEAGQWARDRISAGEADRDLAALAQHALVKRLIALETEVSDAIAARGAAAEALSDAAIRARSCEARLATVEERLAEAAHMVDVVLGSSSWKLTRPLRRLRGSTRPEAPG